MGTYARLSLGALLILVIGGCSIVSTVVSVNNELVSLEEGLSAQYKQNQNTYDSMYKTVTEMVGVTSKYSKDFKEAYDGVMKGRYGEEGSKALFQLITENNPQLDASLYKQIQQTIEANRGEFKAEQENLLDKKRVYMTTLKQFPTSVIAKVLGFPKLDLSKIDIVTSDRTEKAFDSKKDEPLEIK